MTHVHLSSCNGCNEIFFFFFFLNRWIKLYVRGGWGVVGGGGEQTGVPGESNNNSNNNNRQPARKQVAHIRRENWLLVTVIEPSPVNISDKSVVWIERAGLKPPPVAAWISGNTASTSVPPENCCPRKISPNPVCDYRLSGRRKQQ